MVKWMNRHERKRKHKRILKKKFGYSCLYSGYRTNTKLMEDEYRADDRYNNERNGGYHYWINYALSGPRQYAKDATNGVIRAKYRDLLKTMSEEDMDDIYALNHSDYEKYYDYDWTIW